MAETGNQRNLTKGEKTSTSKSREDFSGASGVVEKLRQYYHRDNITACVDAVTNLGDYLELEVLVDAEGERPQALKRIKEQLKKLGYSMEETTRISYLSMLEENVKMKR